MKPRSKTTKNYVADKLCPPVLLVTDIGRDIDDTLALLALAGAVLKAQCCLVGVVVCGGVLDERATLILGWLNALGMNDVPVAMDRRAHERNQSQDTPNKTHTAFVPTEFEQFRNRTRYPVSDSNELIMSSVSQHSEELVCMVIGPLTPLASVLDTEKGEKGGDSILQSLASLYVQGQAHVSDGSILTPDLAAFNLREDAEASRRVFAVLQRRDLNSTVPMRLLGKHAAYQVDVLKSDFEHWSRCGLGPAVSAHTAQCVSEKPKTPETPETPETSKSKTSKTSKTSEGKQEERTRGRAPDVLEHAKGTMNKFRFGSPELFGRLYKLSPALSASQSMDWFDHVTTLSHPYDPLCVLLLLQPELFDQQYQGPHVLVGNTPEEPGVPDAESVRTALNGLIETAMQHAAKLVSSDRKAKKRSRTHAQTEDSYKGPRTRSRGSVS